MNYLLSEIEQVTQGNLKGKDVRCLGLDIDSRRIHSGDLFVALSGEHCHGIDFWLKAKEKGAVALLTDTGHQPGTDLDAFVQVNDPVRALGLLAEDWRNRQNCKVIAVTGSNGKTTVKNFIKTVLSKQTSVHATGGNFNNEIGLPLTVLGLTDQEYCVAEMGAGQVGDIRYLTNIARPDVAVITLASSAHLSGFKSLDAIIKTKGELVESLPDDGVAVLNRDDMAWAKWLEMAQNRKVISFGTHPDSDVRLLAYQNQNMTCAVHDQKITLQLPVPGKHQAMNACAALAAVMAVGEDAVELSDALENAELEAGRMQQISLKNKSVLIDDSYNANPGSVKAAIDTLVQNDSKEKYLILGDMKELGHQSEQLHFEIGEYARENGINYFLATGEQSQFATKAFGVNGRWFKNQAELITYLLKQNLEQVYILVKGSRSMEMERVVEQLISEIGR